MVERVLGSLAASGLSGLDGAGGPSDPAGTAVIRAVVEAVVQERFGGVVPQSLTGKLTDRVADIAAEDPGLCLAVADLLARAARTAGGPGHPPGAREDP